MATYILDKEHSNSVAIASPTCYFCRHHSGYEISERKCVAFPDGIPLNIWNGKDDHAKPYKGDNGIQFEPIQIKRAA